MDPASFLSALLAIVVIDLVLAGDNAIVIALAARSLPPALQKRAIVWGAIGAIGVRSLMTVIVVWLLHIPGLLLGGGLALLWIAYRLLVPGADGKDKHGAAPATFWGAMRTIVIADAVMGLDNVLAVAGAAHGSYLLVVAGLAISVPIVVWGSTVVLKVVDRFPGAVYLGARVLVWTAAKMIGAEPLLKPWLDATPLLGALLYLAIPAVLGVAFVKNQRRLQSRIRARLASPDRMLPLRSSDRMAMHAAAATPHPAAASSPSTSGGLAVLNVLVPVDASPNALRAVRHAIADIGDLREVLSAQASFDVTPKSGGRYHVAGHVRARIGQTCVVTLEPMESDIDEPVDMIFAPPEQIPELSDLVDDAAESDEEIPDPPEPIENGIIDLGRVATDALYLAVDPYPRKPDAVFEPLVEAADPEDHPFAALKALKADEKPAGANKPKAK